MDIKPIETVYKGIRFRSKLEAQWAVYFDQCGIDWEYEPEGFDLGDGVWYLPDFLLHNIVGRPFYDYENGDDVPSDLWVEVKGVMTDKDAEKIKKWIGDIPMGSTDIYYHPIAERPTLILGPLPFFDGDPGQEIGDWIYRFWGDQYKDWFYSYQTIDSDYWQCFIGVNQEGKPTLMEPEKPHRYRNNEDWEQTGRNLFYARNYRFDHRSK